MSRSYQPMPEVPYQSHMPVYYPQTYQQAPPRMPAMEYHYNPELSYPQVAPAPVNWQVFPRQPSQRNDELVSPLANTMKFQHPVQGQTMPMQQARIQYSAVPYMMQPSSTGIQVPRSADAPNRGELRADQGPPRAGMVVNMMKPLNAAALDASSSESSGTSKSLPVSLSSSISPNSAAHKNGKGAHSHTSDPSANVCEVCGKVFQKPYNLKSHMKTHSTERPFKCLFCPKTFARSHDRKRHENLHGGQKNFKCEGYLRNGVTRWGCGKKFARSDALSRHFRTETGYLCIKQFMDEEKEREACEEHRQALQYPHMHPAPPFYHQQQPQALTNQTYSVAPGMRPYDQMSHMQPQILLPPLLRH
ncbi:hypothetical protein METBIDRAFT_13283 [Metschnikowia bicuspidata var. bicuspidata NRRL YB-4993]|uniref:C2H2-type domain-containing protein n=1 Tax=Metschnikowia bicuspidata var. bicuspidata NRRL YB-4993 TaxID=869754 RepID=A0A1A0H670_9ASCO|nr:hypothetical protein METBIDRAFT_13283 [Metschnikowia bicuspidata var. bicuspidata NRRL YB-4993]OBA19526.1 hypothetical protein METBIDRAFT_13283 [Metschnikowia bicuspidata var. bicuspidata NRRL YB-4993]